MDVIRVTYRVLNVHMLIFVNIGRKLAVNLGLALSVADSAGAAARHDERYVEGGGKWESREEMGESRSTVSAQ